MLFFRHANPVAPSKIDNTYYTNITVQMKYNLVQTAKKLAPKHMLWGQSVTTLQFSLSITSDAQNYIKGYAMDSV